LDSSCNDVESVVGSVGSVSPLVSSVLVVVAAGKCICVCFCAFGDKVSIGTDSGGMVMIYLINCSMIGFCDKLKTTNYTGTPSTS
jgi:hypothetical protein